MKQPLSGISAQAVKLLFNSSMGELLQSAFDDAFQSVIAAVVKAATIAFLPQVILKLIDEIKRQSIL